MFTHHSTTTWSSTSLCA